LAIFFCVPFLGCELQQNPKPYEFKEEGQEPDNPPNPKLGKPTPITRTQAPPSVTKGSQDPNKSFNEVKGSIVKGSPRHDFPNLVFPE
jgi:hypothetical protein